MQNSLNDILFILLVLFLIVATLGNPNIVKVNNPAGKKIQRQNKTSLSLSIRIKNYFLGKTNEHINLIDTILRAEVLRQRALLTRLLL